MGTKIEEIRGKFVIFFFSLPGEGSGRVLGGFGKILGGFWRALGGPGGPNGDQNGGNSWTFRHPVLELERLRGLLGNPGAS